MPIFNSNTVNNWCCWNLMQCRAAEQIYIRSPTDLHFPSGLKCGGCNSPSAQRRHVDGFMLIHRSSAALMYLLKSWWSWNYSNYYCSGICRSPCLPWTWFRTCSLDSDWLNPVLASLDWFLIRFHINLIGCFYICGSVPVRSSSSEGHAHFTNIQRQAVRSSHKWSIRGLITFLTLRSSPGVNRCEWGPGFLWLLPLSCDWQDVSAHSWLSFLSKVQADDCLSVHQDKSKTCR